MSKDGQLIGAVIGQAAAGSMLLVIVFYKLDELDYVAFV
jgi:hypothetical protein